MYTEMNRLDKALQEAEDLCGKKKGSFAYYTITRRLPYIIDKIINNNDYENTINQQLASFAGTIPAGALQPVRGSGPDLALWSALTTQYQDQTWLDLPFFFAEFYFYRKILEITRYFEIGPASHVDPFDKIKRESLKSNQAMLAVFAQKVVNALRSQQSMENDLQEILLMNLWGNNADLSQIPDAESGRLATGTIETDTILVNHVDQAINVILKKLQTVHFFLDNAGYELVSNLFLACYLLESGLVGSIVLHGKYYPMFVSDAYLADFENTVQFLAHHPIEHLRQLGIMLLQLIKKGKLIYQTDPFWSLPLGFFQLPEHLFQQIMTADLTIIIGDLNYRRLIGDKERAYTMPLEKLTHYFPGNFLVIRTLKSEVAAGLNPEVIEKIQSKDQDWMVNGKYGLIQLGKTPKNSR